MTTLQTISIEITTALGIKYDATKLNDIQEILCSGEIPLTQANEICEMLDIEKRHNRSEIKRIIEHHNANMIDYINDRFPIE